MKELSQYTVELTRNYTFYLYQEENQDLSKQIGKIFNPDDFWVGEEEKIVFKDGTLSIDYLQRCTSKNLYDILAIENNKLIDLEDSEEIIEKLIEEKILKEEEQEFFKNQLKLNI